MQLHTQHSCIIDCFPNPGLRDALILNYNHSPLLDQLWWDCLDCWVVTVEDIATILTDVDSETGLIGVWNIIEAMDGSRVHGNSYSSMFAPLNVEGREAQLPGMDYFAGILNTPAALRYASNGNIDNSDPCQVEHSTETLLQAHSDGWAPVSLDLILSSKELARGLFYHLNVRAPSADESETCGSQFLECH